MLVIYVDDYILRCLVVRIKKFFKFVNTSKKKNTCVVDCNIYSILLDDGEDSNQNIVKYH